MHRLRWPLAGVLGAFMASITYAANRGISHPGITLVKALPYGDKIGHLVLWGGFTLVLNRAIGSRAITVFGRAVPVGTAVVSIVVILEESSQGFLANRTLDPGDLAANFFGIGLATLARTRHRSMPQS